MQIGICIFSVLLVLCSSTVQAAFPDPLTNTATVTVPAGVTDPNTSNNTATDSNTLNLPSLTLAKVLASNADEDGCLGDTLTYSVTATNNGTSTLNNVVVTDSLITPNSNTCATLAPSAACVLSGTYVVQASDVTAGNIQNTGDANSDEIDPPPVVVDTPVIRRWLAILMQ